MGVSGLGQLRGAEFKSHWYTGVEWGFQPQFQDLKSRSSESHRRAILKRKVGELW